MYREDEEGHRFMTYLIFSGMDYEAQGGMADLCTVIKTKEDLLNWAQDNLPLLPHHWGDIVDVTESGCYDIDEDTLLKGKIVRTRVHTTGTSALALKSYG